MQNPERRRGRGWFEVDGMLMRVQPGEGEQKPQGDDDEQSEAEAGRGETFSGYR